MVPSNSGSHTGLVAFSLSVDSGRSAHRKRSRWRRCRPAATTVQSFPSEAASLRLLRVVWQPTYLFALRRSGPALDSCPLVVDRDAVVLLSTVCRSIRSRADFVNFSLPRVRPKPKPPSPSIQSQDSKLFTHTPFPPRKLVPIVFFSFTG